jgi:hypothetical protein
VRTPAPARGQRRWAATAGWSRRAPSSRRGNSRAACWRRSYATSSGGFGGRYGCRRASRGSPVGPPSRRGAFHWTRVRSFAGRTPPPPL